MIALALSQTKEFMKQLLIGDSFDSFLLTEAVITTYATFAIDGTYHPEFYPEGMVPQESVSDRGYIYWRHIKPSCLELIKGKNTPVSFRFTFALNQANTEKLLSSEGISLTAEQVSGLFLNIRFEQGSVKVTTAEMVTVFTLDKSLGKAWDQLVKRFFDKKGISYEEL